MPESNIHFPKADTTEYVQSWRLAKCAVMQGGQGEVKHWAFNDPLKREGKYQDAPPSPDEYRQLGTRVVDLHPMTIIQNARTSGGGCGYECSAASCYGRASRDVAVRQGLDMARGCAR